MQPGLALRRMLRQLRQGQTGVAQALAAFALLAMVLRALLPPGFMLAPAETGQNLLSVRLCSGHGPIDFMLDPASGALIAKADVKGDAPKKAPQADAPCVFAAMAPMAAPIVFAQPAMLAVHMTTVFFQRILIAPGLGLAAPPPWATGPPLRH